MRSRILPVLVLGLLLGVLLGPRASPAVADDRIDLSRDGRDWGGAQQQRPLFDPAERWVPGDVRSATLWVRNQAEDVADLRVEVDCPGLARQLESGDVTVAAETAGRRVQAGSLPAVVAQVDRLAPGGSVPVRLTVQLDPAATAETMALSGELGVRVHLVEVRDEAAGGAGSGLPGLARTGVGLPSWLVLLALAVTASGGAAVLAGRAERRRT